MQRDARDLGDLDRYAADRVDRSPIHAAVVFEYPEEWVTGREVAMYARCAVDGKSPGVLAKSHESGRMVDLGIDDQNRDDRCVAHRASRLKGCAALQFGAQVGKNALLNPSTKSDLISSREKSRCLAARYNSFGSVDRLRCR